jgi:hypothetical protein
MLDDRSEGDGADRLDDVAVEVGFEGSQIVGIPADRRKCDHGKASEPGEPQVRSETAREFSVDHRHLDVAKHDIRLDDFDDIKGGTPVSHDSDARTLVLKQVLRRLAGAHPILD